MAGGTSGKFHEKQFDNATKLKLEIFREYLQEWIPVFLSPSNRRPYVNIYDFFAGPGCDASGNPGSPLIILDGLKRYLDDDARAKACGVRLRVFFNDADKASIEHLRQEIRDDTSDPRFHVDTESLDFHKAFERELPMLRRPESANLVILDQFGYRFINSEVFTELMRCPTTDIIFFISSANIKRFAEEESTQQYFRVSKEMMSEIPPNDIHRFICRDCYQSWIPQNVEYYLAPFSIKKDDSGNIYGLIFGSGSLRGLEKFLKVCWNEDKVTGEANFNIDCDALREGLLSLFEEDNVYKKQDKFRREVVSYISALPRDNRELYRFCLQMGFLPKHMRDILGELQDSGSLIVEAIGSEQSVRRGAFYLTWAEYDGGISRALFRYKGKDNASQ